MSMPAPKGIRRCLSSFMARVRSAACTATSSSMPCAVACAVIVPDLPHYGMSGPGNLDKSPARTMQDMRDVVHELVVNQLGIKQAYYLGHSLGGQLVMGYALTWPEALQGLALEAPAGLEQYPREITVAKARRHRCLTLPLLATSKSGSRPGARPASWPWRSGVRSRTSAISSISRSVTPRPASYRRRRAATSTATARMPAFTPNSASG